MEVFSTLIGIALAASIGFYLGRNHSADANEKNRLASELQKAQEELEAFRNKVNSHFETTAELFNQVSDSYQSLYDHMAKSSGQLCATPSFQSLPSSPSAELETKSTNPDNQPDQNFNELFDAEKLYNAHDYPKEDASEQQKTAAVRDEKVVDIESAKEDKTEPALDYAIKESGVINHNSLEAEGAKTS